MKNLLIVGTNFPPSQSIGTQRIVRICKYLLNYQWNISVLSLKEKYYQRQMSDEDEPIGNFLRNIKIKRTRKLNLFLDTSNLKEKYSKGEEKISRNLKEEPYESCIKEKTYLIRKKLKELREIIFDFPDKEINWFPIAIFCGYNVIKKNKIDVIFSSSPPHTNHLIATFLKIFTQKKLVVDFRDPWARSVWEEQQSTILKRIKNKLELFLEKWVVKNADKITFITSELRDDFMKYYPSFLHDKFYVFLNGYDPDNTLRLPVNINKNSEKFIFTHTGTLYKKRDPSQIIYAVKDIIESKKLMRENFVIKFVGKISQELSYVVDIVHKFGLQDIIQFFPPVSYNKSFEYMSESNILILLQPETHLQIPAKLYDYMCFDKPILALGKKGGATENIIRGRFGIFSDYDNIDDIRNSIIYLYNNPFYKVEMIRKNREEYNIEKSIKFLNKILEC